MRYWAALDGLRGLAVLAVVLFHANVHQLHGGFLGVDVFFVLSGFLITAQLLRELDKTGKISLKQFFLRRVVRLQPALLLLLSTYLLAWAIGLTSGSSTGMVTDLILVLFALTHWARAFNWHDPAYLGHTWSLGVEEQFYLLWPIFISILGHRALKPLRVALLAAIAAIAGLLWMRWLHAHGASSSRLYNGLDTRAMALLCGCVLAGWLHSKKTNALKPPLNKQSNESMPINYSLIGWIALAGLLGLMIYADWRHPLMFSWGYLGAALLAMSLITSVVCIPDSKLATLLAWSPLVELGKISYGLYLWHYPLFRIASEQAKTWDYPVEMCLLVAGLVALGAAFGSYKWLERPLRKRIFGH